LTGKPVPEDPVKSLLPKLGLSLKEENSVPDLLELAMQAEKVSEEFYDNLSEEVEERGVQEILQYLSRMEHGHYALLKGEYDLCVRDELYYQRDDFQYDMVHIGP
jgi:rubrerythrin